MGERVWQKTQVFRGSMECLCGELIACVCVFTTRAVYRSSESLCLQLYSPGSFQLHESVMPKKRCCACGMQLGNCRQRHKLFSEAILITVFLHFLAYCLLTWLFQRTVSGLLPKDSLICKKPCFSSLDSMVTQDALTKGRDCF